MEPRARVCSEEAVAVGPPGRRAGSERRGESEHSAGGGRVAGPEEPSVRCRVRENLPDPLTLMGDSQATCHWV